MSFEESRNHVFVKTRDPLYSSNGHVTVLDVKVLFEESPDSL